MVIRNPCPALRLLAGLVVLAAVDLPREIPELSAQAITDPVGKISGSVVESRSGHPISGARVVLEPLTGSADARSRVAETDAAGLYTFVGLEAGRYRLDVAGLGFRSATVWVELPPAWRLRRSFELAVEPIELQPLVVSPRSPPRPWDPALMAGHGGAPPASPFGAELARHTLDARVIVPADVQEWSTLGEPDLFRALQRLPGVSGRGDFSAGLWTRGAPWGLTRILLDGLPLYDPLHLGGMATGLAAEGLDAAFLLPGARPAGLSEGVAGMVSLATRRAGQGRTGSFAVSPVAARVHAEDRWGDGRLGLSLTARRSWWDVVRPPSVIAGAGSTRPVEYHFADVSGRVDLRIEEVGTLEAGGLWEEDRLDGEIHDLVAASDGRWGNRVGWVALERRAGTTTSLRLFAGRSAYEVSTRPKPWMSFYGTGRTPSLETLEISLSRSVVRAEAGGRLADGLLGWQAGLEHARERLRQQGADAWDRKAPGVDVPAGASWSRAWADGTLAAGSLSLSGGLSFDWTGEDLPGLGLRPSLRARWDATDRLTVELARSENRQFSYPLAPAGPSFGPALRVGHVWITAGEGRAPLTSGTTTLSAEARPAPGYTVLVSAWRRWMRGLWMHGVSTVHDGALGDASPEGTTGAERAEGVEVTVRRQGDRVRGEVSYTLGRSQLEGESGTRWASPADRRHSLDFGLTGRVARGFRVGTLFRLESGWPIVLGPWSCDLSAEQKPQSCDVSDPDRPRKHSYARGPAYASLDLVLDWTHRGGRVDWGVSASLRNVLGRNNAAVYRASTCQGAELLSPVCDGTIGKGRFAPGLGDPTPAVALRVTF